MREAVSDASSLPGGGVKRFRVPTRLDMSSMTLPSGVTGTVLLLFSTVGIAGEDSGPRIEQRLREGIAAELSTISYCPE